MVKERRRLPDPAFWSGKRVLVTGHTGFKGGWLTLWLSQLGAVVHGYALDPPTSPNLFEVARIRECLASDIRADLADLSALKAVLVGTQPEVVFHLAAQPLVRESYKNPVGTLATNVMGTANVLEAARSVKTVRAIVLITTDKVYCTQESGAPCREGDPLGGDDPYSASKAAAEIVAASYRSSFFRDEETSSVARIATARSGNVIGGGDWAEDRLIPDCFRAFGQGKPVRLRYPQAVRPWQHVLEPLAGYLLLGERLSGAEASDYAAAWNFGPEARDDASVEEVARVTARLWGGNALVEIDSEFVHPHEAGLLRLDITRARKQLDWQPRWSLERALQNTVDWHKAWLAQQDMSAHTISQIHTYRKDVVP